MKEISPADAFAFALRVMACGLPHPTRYEIEGPVDAAYLFGQSEDNQISVLDAVFVLKDLKPPTKQIAICGLGNESGYLGAETWRAELALRGIHEHEIVEIPRTAEAISNTFTEAVELVRYAKAHGWKRVICVAPEFHLPRAYLGIVTALRTEYPALLAYPHPGMRLPWKNRPVAHSQGVTRGTRAELVYGEFERIVKYDNLLHPIEAIRYLDSLP